jgi:hypothetical protein
MVNQALKNVFTGAFCGTISFGNEFSFPYGNPLKITP